MHARPHVLASQLFHKLHGASVSPSHAFSQVFPKIAGHSAQVQTVAGHVNGPVTDEIVLSDSPCLTVNVHKAQWSRAATFQDYHVKKRFRAMSKHAQAV
eukprot:1510418-Pleurochrysis_carterae.AAC.1